MNDQPELPTLPYAGTSGHSGSATSRERAIRNDKDGTTKTNQRVTLNYLLETGRLGLTWKELSMLTGWHHGTASGVLSVLHKEGSRVVRLVEKRGRSAIYVLKTREFIDGRTLAVRKVKCCQSCGAER